MILLLLLQLKGFYGQITFWSMPRLTLRKHHKHFTLVLVFNMDWSKLLAPFSHENAKSKCMKIAVVLIVFTWHFEFIERASQYTNE